MNIIDKYSPIDLNALVFVSTLLFLLIGMIETEMKGEEEKEKISCTIHQTSDTKATKKNII